MKKNIIIIIILTILIVLSTVQAFHLNSIMTKLSGSSVRMVTENQQTNQEKGSLPKSIRDLPPMVGIC